MSASTDKLGVIRDHRWIKAAEQRKRLEAEGCRGMLELDGKKNGVSQDALVRMSTAGRTFVFAHAFLLADPKCKRKRGGIKANFDVTLEAMTKRGAAVKDLETGLTTEDKKHRKAITALAHNHIARSNQGLRSALNGKKSKGRPKDWVDPAERGIIWEEWHSTTNKTNGQASDAASKRIGRYVSPNTMWKVVKEMRAEKGIGGSGASGRRPNVKALIVAQGTRKAQGFVYFLKNGRRNQIKIGYGASFRDRVSHLNVSSPEALRLLAAIPGDRALEGELHARFRQHWIRGEWFKLEGALATFVSGLPKPPRSR